jgi:imidazolonepropionase-like amidohydrolase
MKKTLWVLGWTALLAASVSAQELARGPYQRLVIRGATVIDGTGAPPEGPMDIVVEGGKITEIKLVGDDFGKVDPKLRPRPGDFDLDAASMYVLPGFVNAHVHLRNEKRTGLPVTYDYYLRLGHGVTTVLEAGSASGLEWTVSQKQASARHEVVAPRIFAYVFPFIAADKPNTSPALAREWVRKVAQMGADGLKLTAHRPDIMEAMIDEAHQQGIRTTAHLAQSGVTRMNALDAARLKLDSLQHWYGLAEAMLVDRSIPDWRFNHNHNNEQDRFSDAGRFWSQAAEPGSAPWKALLDELLALDFTMVPTMVAYEGLRDHMRVAQAEWHEAYSAPKVLEDWLPNPDVHGSNYFFWTTQDEANWYHMFYKWQRFVNEFKNRGGRVAAGADEGSAYNLPGFGYIREFEILQQAGFHPLEVIRSATLYGAQTLGVGDQLGSIEVGKTADFVITEQNPLENFKLLYGTGAKKYDPATGKTTRVGGVKYTIKDGIVYDARALLREVRRMVEEAKHKGAPTPQ